MIFRSLAALVFVAGAALLVTMVAMLGMAPGVPLESNHLRNMKNRLDTPNSYDALTLAEYHGLPSGASVGEYSAHERRAVQLEGHIQRMLLAGDGDLHLELDPAVVTGPVRDSAYVPCEITPGFRREAARWKFEALASVFRPRHGTATEWTGGPQRVRVSGWLLYDFQYARLPSPWSLEHDAPRMSGWEIHPVTRIEVWDTARLAFVEVPR